ncbi:MAG: aspartate/tyrosine/aromatic aminotransferase [Cohaesibacter sp.]|nr:aspartate/tyrosine/aromatic aminotransferase [Cohaesibacter sp.]MCV6600385.1 aspartate/tyrosine/aromatic aminotransferase [Cohaesibacter sp.]
MFEMMKKAEGDKILALMGLYRADTRPNKVDLGVGVYKDAHGKTPIMSALGKAERWQISHQASKSYVGLAGDVGFNDAITALALGQDYDRERVRSQQAPGGSGALRIVAELLAGSKEGATIWVSDPTWPNHIPIFSTAGLTIKHYPYFDADSGQVRFEAMIEALRAIPERDIVLLHGCCHNPTGANLSLDQWKELGSVLVERSLFPFIDIAYQGFGDGLDEDAAGLRHLAQIVPEMAIALSCSKNFAVYCDRVGAAILLGRNGDEADKAISQLALVARKSYSMPPNHGASVIRHILQTDDLHSEWQAELEAMRLRMLTLRTGLAESLRQHTNSDRFDFVANHRGMFSRLGLSLEQVEQLRLDHAIYMVGDSRINVAGLPDDGLEDLAAAIASVL